MKPYISLGKFFTFQVYILGGTLLDSVDDNNNFVEVMDTRNGTIVKSSDHFYPVAKGGLGYACLIALPEDNAFVVIGGEINGAAR
jgi:hypothetical protein